MVLKLLLLFLFALNGFGILGLSNTIILLGIICIANNAFMKPNPYKNILLLILFGIFLSFIPANIYRGQSYFDTFRASGSYFYLITFFAIFKLKPKTEDAETAMVYLSLITSFIYIAQYILLPTGVVFLKMPEVMIDESAENAVGRFRIVGSGIYSLVFFYGVNKYILCNKLKYIGISLVNLIPIILMGFRTMLAGIALFSFFLLLKTTGGRFHKIFLYAFIAGMTGIIMLQIPAINSRVDMMIEKQAEGDQTFANSNYIRLIQLDYYLNEYPEGILDRVLGSGLAFENTSFGKFQSKINELGLFWVDWGLIGLMWMLGPFTVLFMIWLNIRCCKIVPSKEYLYITIWLIYLISISITTKEYFRGGNFTIHSIVMYISYSAYMESKKLKYKKNEDRNNYIS